MMPVEKREVELARQKEKEMFGQSRIKQIEHCKITA